jgi:hypothetical protein
MADFPFSLLERMTGQYALAAILAQLGASGASSKCLAPEAVGDFGRDAQASAI